MVWAATLFTFFFGNPFIYNVIIGWWEPPIIAYKEIPTAKTAFVMGGALNIDEHVGHFSMNSNADRLLVPFYLLQEQRIENLVVSAARYGKLNAPNHLVLYKAFLAKLGADTSSIYVETKSLNSYHNAVYGNAFMKEKNLLDKRPILLVTTALHMRRAAACFKKEGVNFIAVPVRTQTKDANTIGFTDYFMPGLTTIYNWGGLAKEMVGLLSYKILGYC